MPFKRFPIPLQPYPLKSLQVFSIRSLAMITGFELALAVLPLVISATEHHKKVLRPAEAILSTKRKNEHHLIFYEELYDELALLGNTLKTVGGNLVSRLEAEAFSTLNPDEHDEIERVLGSSAQPFSDHLERLLRSLNDLVSEKSLGLNRSDVSDVSALSPKVLSHFD
jgi:hypothetical protein